MISFNYLLEKLSVNQYVYANADLEKKLQKARKSGNKEKTKTLHNARERLIDKTSAEAWKREPQFMKAQQKDRQARRLRDSAYGQITKPDLEADIARKIRVAKRKGVSYIRTAKKFGKALTAPMPNLSAPSLSRR